MVLHTYKICDVVPREDQRVGRPRRNILVSWFGLTPARLKKIRRKREPRLKVGQFAELDGKIVARGPRTLEVVAPASTAEAEELDEAEDLDAEDLGDEDADDDDDDDDDGDEEDEDDNGEAGDAGDAGDGPNPDHPVGVTKHATRLLWDAYQRHAVASAELREQTNELNRRAIAQAKQLDEMLIAFQNRQPPPPPPPAPPPPPINVSLDDLYNVLRIGATIFKDAKSAGDKDKEPPKS